MESAAILVVYNRYAGESEAGRCLTTAPPGTRVLLYDNSDREYQNRAFCQAHGWTYLGGEGNKGLSKAYNACVARLKDNAFSGLICIFDDDTQISPDYFSAMGSAAEAHPEHAVFFPLLRSGDRIVSPQIIHENQHAEFFSSGKACLNYNGPDFYAFNSGMAVRSEVFLQAAYNEALFLDGIDYAFLRTCYKQGFSSIAVDVEMEHGFSGAQRPAYGPALARFQNYAKDYAVVLKDNPGGYRFLVGKRALHLALIYHKISFFRVYLQNRPRR